MTAKSEIDLPEQIDDVPILALMTAPGRGAIATVCVRGPSAASLLDEGLFFAANGRSMAMQGCGRLVFGRWGDDSSEDVVICRIDESTTEIHCHGGDLAARRIMDDLIAAGCRPADWPTLASADGDVFAEELQSALAAATTVRTAEILLRQKHALRIACRTLEQCADAAALVTKIDELLQYADFGRHLVRPWDVVIAGRPNAGKSSLINALVGYSRTIVYSEPGTTRDVVTAETAFDGWPVRLSDTAGIRDDTGRLEAAGIERATSRMDGAELRILLIDTSRSSDETDRDLAARWPDAICVAHKSDLPVVDRSLTGPGSVAVSSITMEGVEQLIGEIVSRLVPDVPPVDAAIVFTQRQMEQLQTARTQAAGGDVATAHRNITSIVDSNTG